MQRNTASPSRVTSVNQPFGSTPARGTASSSGLPHRLGHHRHILSPSTTTSSVPFPRRGFTAVLRTGLRRDSHGTSRGASLLIARVSCTCEPGPLRLLSTGVHRDRAEGGPKPAGARSRVSVVRDLSVPTQLVRGDVSHDGPNALRGPPFLIALGEDALPVINVQAALSPPARPREPRPLREGEGGGRLRSEAFWSFVCGVCIRRIQDSQSGFWRQSLSPFPRSWLWSLRERVLLGAREAARQAAEE